MAPPDQRDEKAAQAAVEALKAPLNALDESLKGKEYLLGKNFTIADLNVAAVHELDADDEARYVVDAQRAGVAAKMSRPRSQQKGPRSEVGAL